MMTSFKSIHVFFSSLIRSGRPPTVKPILRHGHESSPHVPSPTHKRARSRSIFVSACEGHGGPLRGCREDARLCLTCLTPIRSSDDSPSPRPSVKTPQPRMAAHELSHTLIPNGLCRTAESTAACISPTFAKGGAKWSDSRNDITLAVMGLVKVGGWLCGVVV